MASQIDRFRRLNRLEYPPAFMSLGLPAERFVDGETSRGSGFDTALTGPGDTIWLFRGEDVMLYDLRNDVFVGNPAPIARSFARGALPGDFAFGIDSAVWGGPTFPDSWFLFRDANFIRLQSRPDPANGTDIDPSLWGVSLDKTPTQQEFLRLPGQGGIDFGPAVRVHGLRDAADRVHCFNAQGLYARHNFMNGELDDGPVPITERFPLPASFGGTIDLAFYGAGQASEHLFLFSGFEFIEFDVRSRRVVQHEAVEQRFPVLALSIPRPQLFLVEEYALDTFVGPAVLGDLINVMTVPAQSERESVVVTQITQQAATVFRQNVLESQSSEAKRDFFRKIDKASETESQSNSYQYRMNALFQGEASASSLWGGEVEARLNVEGGSDEQRDRFAKSSFASVSAQTSESTHSVDQRAMTSDEASSITSNVFSKESFRLVNTTLQTRQIELFRLLQPFVSLMVLQNVKAAYTDGLSRPDVFVLNDLPRRLPQLLSDPDEAADILAYIKRELSRIQDSTGDMRAILVPGDTLQTDSRVKSRFTFDGSDPPQTIEITGIVKAVDDFIQPTYLSRAIDITQGGAAIVVEQSGGIAPVVPILGVVGAPQPVAPAPPES
jgi:hypothetical protein